MIEAEEGGLGLIGDGRGTGGGSGSAVPATRLIDEGGRGRTGDGRGTGGGGGRGLEYSSSRIMNGFSASLNPTVIRKFVFL